MKKILLWLFYNFVKTIVQIAYWCYFDKITYVNGERMRRGKPCIIASNHPNCLVDAMLVAKKSNRIVHFLANIGIFKPPFWKWFFETFYTIPVQRYMDTGGKKIDNSDAFHRCDEFLIQGGALFIAPQGTSWVERKLGKIKTGTARIALSAASKQSFDTALEIIPVGVTYKDPLAFRKSVVVKIGEPIQIAGYKSGYESNQRETVGTLTDDLTEAMRVLTIDAVTDEKDDLLRKHETIISGAQPLQLFKELTRTDQLLAKLNQMELNATTAFNSLKVKTNQYFQILEEQKLTDKAVHSQPSFSVLGTVKYILGLPFFLYGFLNNILAFGIPVWVKNQIKVYKGFYSSIKMVGGLITVPFFYTIQIFIVSKIFQNPLITWGYALSLLPLGLLAWHYKENYSEFRKAWKLSKNTDLKRQLLDKRAELDFSVRSLLEN